MVGLIDNDDISQLLNPAEPIRKFAATQQVRVVVYRQIAVLAEQLGQILPQLALPDRLARGLRNKERYPLALALDERFDEHQADECLAQSHAIAQECAMVLFGNA